MLIIIVFLITNNIYFMPKQEFIIIINVSCKLTRQFSIPKKATFKDSEIGMFFHLAEQAKICNITQNIILYTGKSSKGVFS